MPTDEEGTMAEIVFYEKPGCINNTKQKKLLESAGHHVIAVDLISHRFTEQSLLDFFDGLEVKEWFNPNAPDVYNGIVKPETYTRQAALAVMTSNPLLIKRPLIDVNGKKFVGFDHPEIKAMLPSEAASTPETKVLLKENLTDCPKKAANTTCDTTT